MPVWTMRIVSLLPSATEIVCALGLQKSLVGVTHECDFPPGVDCLPRLTTSLLDPALSSREIDTLVSASIKADAHTIYGLDADLLVRLAPDVILTQSLCEVCAVPTAMVEDAVCTMPRGARIVALEPLTLDGVLDSIAEAATALGVEAAGLALVEQLESRIESVRLRVAGQAKRRVLAAEWLDPVYCGGHWVPDMIAAAGGDDCFGTAGEPSHPLQIVDIQAVDPDVIILMPCGYGVQEIVARYCEVEALPGWKTLRAVKEHAVYAVDASAFFSRPGPRLVDGLELLAEIFHPGQADEASRSMKLSPAGCFVAA